MSGIFSNLFPSSVADTKPAAIDKQSLKPPPSYSAGLASRAVSTDDDALSQQDRMTQEISCCICLDIMVHPQTLVPCGHSFCGQCLDPIKECPQCREKITGRVPSRQLESLISSLVKIPNMIDDDDKAHYEERLKKETPREYKDMSSRSKKRKHSRSSGSRRSRREAASGSPVTLPTGTVIFPNGGMMIPRSATVWPNSSSTSRRRGRTSTNAAAAAGTAASPGAAAPSTTTTSSNNNNFDPMTAPLPPPFDNEASGAAPPPAPPLWGMAGSGNTSNNSGATSSSSASAAAAPQALQGPQGTSVEDAICID